MSDDEYDNLFDDFSAISGSEWNTILPAEQQAATIQTGHGTEPLASPDEYFGDDDVLDSSFLAAVDAIEHAATGAGPSRGALLPVNVPSTAARSAPVNSSANRTSTSFLPGRHQNHGVPPGSLKRERSMSPTTSLFPASKKGKAKAIEEDEDLGHWASCAKLVRKLEDEFQCPVCFDVLAASHIANPCGHSFCGSCGWQWIVQKHNLTCPVCRTTLARSDKMLPNITLDSAIDAYIELLGDFGVTEWQKASGKAYLEWANRKQAWKNEAAKRARQKTAPPAATRTRPVRQPVIYVDEEGEPFEDEMQFASGILNLIPRFQRTHSNRLRPRSAGPSQ